MAVLLGFEGWGGGMRVGWVLKQSDRGIGESDGYEREGMRIGSL